MCISFQASDFFFGAAFLGALGVAAAASASADLLAVDLFSLARMATRLRATPKEPFDLLPLFDFLSPLPMIVFLTIICSNYNDGRLDNKIWVVKILDTDFTDYADKVSRDTRDTRE